MTKPRKPQLISIFNIQSNIDRRTTKNMFLNIKKTKKNRNNDFQHINYFRAKSHDFLEWETKLRWAKFNIRTEIWSQQPWYVQEMEKFTWFSLNVTLHYYFYRQFPPTFLTSLHSISIFCIFYCIWFYVCCISYRIVLLFWFLLSSFSLYSNEIRLEIMQRKGTNYVKRYYKTIKGTNFHLKNAGKKVFDFFVLFWKNRENLV